MPTFTRSFRVVSPASVMVSPGPLKTVPSTCFGDLQVTALALLGSKSSPWGLSSHPGVDKIVKVSSSTFLEDLAPLEPPSQWSVG